ncbi:HpcH/HpaI aldolase family protein [Runella zeae]|uniref:HpcH/HpaI aldolase family protein n=1 Tax=Runella zeae TaxID=94255 RepID=UPI0023537935|nr:aldolase/citrate lyase family protein [Runella zeae]
MTFKEKLHAGEILYGLTLTLGSPKIAEIIAHLGFDWIWIEAEHTTMSLEDILSQLQAVNGTTTTTIVRVDNNNATTIKRVLDTGPDGIIVPSVNTPDEARQAIKALKYPPLGERGIGLGRAQAYGQTLGEYIKTANDKLVTLFMIEHITAVQNIEEILAVEGLDGVIVGSLDLAGSMNLQNDLGNPLLEIEVQKVLAACLKAGVACGIFVGNAQQAKFRIDQGFRIVTLGADVFLLATAAKSALDLVKAT